MNVSIPSLVINGLVAAVTMTLGVLLCQNAPSVQGLKEGMLSFARTLLSKDLQVHHAIFGALFLLVGLAALGNLLALVARGHGFWVV